MPGEITVGIIGSISQTETNGITYLFEIRVQCFAELAQLGSAWLT